MRRSWPRVLLGLAVGFVATGSFLAALAVLGLARGLPADLDAVRAWQAPTSLLVDRAGVLVASFSLVEAVPEAPPPPTLLAEAFLAAAPPSFYEPRVDAATTLPGAALRLARGQPSSASPLSLALARVLLLGEEPGARRQGREELLATSIEGSTTVTARVEAWLDWVPLCRGRRGLERARRECLGTADAGWTDVEMATLAAAAAWGLDLVADPGLLAARRDAVLEQLVRRGLVEPEGARQGGPPRLLPPSPSRDCLPRLLADARRAVGTSPAIAMRLESGLDGDLRALLQRHRVRSALLADVRSGVVRACRGGLEADSTESLAARGLQLAAGGRAPGLRWLPTSEPEAEGAPLERVEAWTALLHMEDEGGLRWSQQGDRLLLADPSLAGAVHLADPTSAASLIQDLRALLPRARALLPDDLEVVQAPGGGTRVRPRAG